MAWRPVGHVGLASRLVGAGPERVRRRWSTGAAVPAASCAPPPFDDVDTAGEDRPPVADEPEPWSPPFDEADTAGEDRPPVADEPEPWSPPFGDGADPAEPAVKAAEEPAPTGAAEVPDAAGEPAAA